MRKPRGRGRCRRRLNAREKAHRWRVPRPWRATAGYCPRQSEHASSCPDDAAESKPLGALCPGASAKSAARGIRAFSPWSKRTNTRSTATWLTLRTNDISGTPSIDVSRSLASIFRNAILAGSASALIRLGGDPAPGRAKGDPPCCSRSKAFGRSVVPGESGRSISLRIRSSTSTCSTARMKSSRRTSCQAGRCSGAENVKP